MSWIRLPRRSWALVLGLCLPLLLGAADPAPDDPGPLGAPPVIHAATAGASTTPAPAPPSALAPVTGTAVTIPAHLAAMAAYSGQLAAQPLDIALAEDDAAVGKRLMLHWQQGDFRLQRSWLGEDEAYAYDGQTYWYGSSEVLPFSIDHALTADVTHQFIPNLYYATPSQATALRPLTGHELAEARKLPQLRGYLLLDYAPAGMSEAWLLLDPQTLLLRGCLLGDGRALETSSVTQITFYDQWQDFGVAHYPAQSRIVTELSDGTQLGEHTLHTLSVTAAAALPPAQFTVASAPPVAQPVPPGGIVSVPFRIIDDGITLDATAADGKPLVLKFDSGANIGLLRRERALSLGLKPAGDEAVSGHGGTAQLQFALVSGVKLGTAEVPPFEVAVTPDDGAPPPDSPGYAYYVARLRGQAQGTLDSSLGEDGVDGLLGTSLLNSYVVRIDYPHRTLTLFGAAQFTPQALGAGAQALPLTRDSLPFTPVTIDSKVHGGAFFNTGARPLFNVASWALEREQLAYPLVGLASGISVHGPQVFGIVRPGVVELGSLRLEHPETYLETLAPGDPPDETRIASFGSTFFHDHVVTFDLAHERVFIQ